MKKETKDWTRKELIEKYVNKYTPLTIPVDISIQGQQTILSLSSLEKILEGARKITLTNCACRTRLRKCHAPRNVCLRVDYSAKAATRRSPKQLSKHQALEVLKRTNEAGLVHMTYTVKGEEKPRYICSCCSCCCHSLGALIRFGILGHVVASEYMASDDLETCNNCGICVQRCQFHARQLVDSKLEFNQAKCFGCGLCATKCPTNSIMLIKRKVTAV
nr:4Fe-4S binding protein [Candidatus Njordarchaeum guaymaensis]